MIPLAYLPVPIRITELDLSEPIRPIEGNHGAATLRILVRSRGTPIRWLTIEEPNDVVTAAEIEDALGRHACWPVQAAALERTLGQRGPESIGAIPPISVVVCTRDRPGSLERCLQSLAAVDYQEHEVIVVDNAPSTDATWQVVTRFAGVRYVRENRPGLDWARNRGIEAANHPIVAFTDDDVRVDAGWLLGLARGFADPEVMMVTGLVEPAELETQAQLTFEYQYGGMGKGFRPARFHRDQLDWVLLLGTHHLGVGANMAFRREIFDRVEPFDTALDVGTPSHGGGDLDMFHRVLAAGAVVRYEPTALVWHSHRRDMAGLRKQLRDNGRAFGVYLLTRWAEAKRGAGVLSPGAVTRYAVHVWLGWMAKRVVRRFTRKEVLSLWLQAEEMIGVLQAPWGLLATRRRDREVRRVALTELAGGHGSG